MQEIVELIQTIGFPIAVCIACFFFIQQIIKENREDNIKLKYLINVDPKTYSKVRFLKPEMIDTDKFVVLMTFSVWQDFLTKSKDLATGKKKTAARVFVYLYY